MAGVLQTSLFALGFGAFFIPITDALNTSRTALSGAFSATRIQGGMLGLLAGFLIDKTGPRVMMMAGFLFFGAGLILTSLVHSVPQFYGTFLITGTGAYLCWYLPSTTTAMNWFSRNRSRAMSIVLLGSVVGGPLVPILTWSINAFGWRPTLAGAGIFVWLVGVPLSTLMRRRPEDYGYAPDGDSPSPAVARRPGSLSPGEPDFTLKQALKSSKFWYLSLAHSISLMAWGAVSVHMIPALVDGGLSEQTASTMAGVMLGVAVIGRLFAGFTADLLGTKRILAVAFAMQTVGLIFLSYATNMGIALVFAIFMGLGYGARGTLLVSFRGELFGKRAFAAITGMSEAILAVGYVASPLLAGIVYDAEKSYFWAFVGLAVLNAIGILFLIPIRTSAVTKRN